MFIGSPGASREEYQHLFARSLNKYLLNAYYVQDTEPGAGLLVTKTALYVQEQISETDDEDVGKALG